MLNTHDGWIYSLTNTFMESYGNKALHIMVLIELFYIS